MIWSSDMVSVAGRHDIPAPPHPITRAVVRTAMPAGVSFVHTAIPARAPGILGSIVHATFGAVVLLFPIRLPRRV